MPDDKKTNGFLDSIRDVIIGLLVVAVAGMTGFVVQVSTCNARQDAEISALVKQIDRNESNFDAIYKEIILIGNDLSALKSNQKQILDRLNR